MRRTAVINVVGLTRGLIGPNTPFLSSRLSEADYQPIRPALPGVTCTAQSDYLTGRPPTDHGIVANGWYDRDLAEVHFWKQPNQLVQSPKVWHELKQLNPDFTCAKLFWWYNMYADVDYSITPRPIYPADGRKFFDIYTWPYSIRPAIKRELGEFPFPCFWGPAAGTQSPQGGPDSVSRWIAESAKWIERRHRPTLSFVYLPHLDYNLQRFGPDDPRIGGDLRAIDAIVGDLATELEQDGVQCLILSEYGITQVDNAIHLNRRFREKGWITIKEELGLERLDFGASQVFAVADHQLAHIYVKAPSLLNEVEALVSSLEGVDRVLGEAEKRDHGLDHSRAGDLVALAKEDSWFTYYYWLDDAKAPDFARCVDIHRKPGYDPAELFIDPEIAFPKLKIASKLIQKKLGFRTMMDLIPLDASLVKGSHGVRPKSQEDWPLLIAPASLELSTGLCSTDVYDVIKSAVLEKA